MAAKKDSVHRPPEDATAMDCVGRTRGDGMENVSNKAAETKHSRCRRLGDSFIYHPTNLKQLSSTFPVTPTGTIVNLTPKNVTSPKESKHGSSGSLKSKEPKFVPYEPYKAAVNPIIPFEKKRHQHQHQHQHQQQQIRAAGDASATVAAGVAAIKIDDAADGASVTDETKSELLDADRWLSERKIFEARVQKLEEDNARLENELKFQAQVNGELKNLLVAAVGEDLETKVHLLTEDKLQLAQALLNSAQHLNTHQEQTEWLAGQCEVWRSKFLASSLMVEELAKWKAALTQRTTELQEAIKKLLEERTDIREISLKTYRTLRILLENFDPAGSYRTQKLPSLNVVDLAQGCSQLAEVLKVQLLSGMYVNLQKEVNINDLETKTNVEKNAEQLLLTNANTLPSRRQDVACSAVMGAAVAIGGQMLLFQKNSSMACCPHCSGEVKQV